MTSTVHGTCPSPPGNGSPFIVVMGVSGSGKSTLGAALAKATQLPFIDGDALHPAENVAKMARGEPLDDADRLPWLEAIRDTAVARVRAAGDDAGTYTARQRPGVIVACSALKRSYRAVLRGASAVQTHFVYLRGDKEVLAARLARREGHFMKAGMLGGQLEALESPEGEPGVVTVAVAASTETQVRAVLDALGSRLLG